MRSIVFWLLSISHTLIFIECLMDRITFEFSLLKLFSKKFFVRFCMVNYFKMSLLDFTPGFQFALSRLMANICSLTGNGSFSFCFKVVACVQPDGLSFILFFEPMFHCCPVAMDCFCLSYTIIVSVDVDEVNSDLWSRSRCSINLF